MNASLYAMNHSARYNADLDGDCDPRADTLGKRAAALLKAGIVIDTRGLTLDQLADVIEGYETALAVKPLDTALAVHIARIADNPARISADKWQALADALRDYERAQSIGVDTSMVESVRLS